MDNEFDFYKYLGLERPSGPFGVVGYEIVWQDALFRKVYDLEQRIKALEGKE